MSKELIEKAGLSFGQKVFYIQKDSGHNAYLRVVTIKDVHLSYEDEIVIYVDEFEGYLNYSDIYTLSRLEKMIEAYDFVL